MPEHQGWRRMSSRYVHGNPGLNTDDPGLTIRDDPCCIREGVKGALGGQDDHHCTKF